MHSSSRLSARALGAAIAVATLFGTAGAADADAPSSGEPERIAIAAPRTTPAGHVFIAPEGFALSTTGSVVRLRPPEGDATIALVDLEATDADDAVAKAWAAAFPDEKRTLKLSTPRAPRDGWDELRTYEYETSPNEKRTVFASVRRAGRAWVGIVVVSSDATFEKRSAPIGQMFASLRPKGYARESFAGRTPHPLDAGRIAVLKAFLADGMRQLDVPGVGFSLIDGNRVVFEGGLGVKAAGRPDPVTAHTLFIAASNTKAMTTLLLAQAVDAGRLRWDEPVVEAYPAFRLGDAEVTRSVLVKHLVCACTGMPRQDFDWLFEYAKAGPATTFEMLAGMKPTSQFGEVFQYSNLMVSAAGYIGAQAFMPGEDLGVAYDTAMHDRVFAPLGMDDSTFDFARALRADHATPHSEDLAGRLQPSRMALNYSIVPARPAGGVWTSPHDFSRFVLMELARGRTVDGRPIVSEANLLERRRPQVLVGEDVVYGMGLFVDKHLDIEVVHHGGDLIGFHSDMIWLPTYGIGATILTNSDSGVFLRGPFLRKLLEVVFDGKPEADQQLKTAAANRIAQIRKERERWTVPAVREDAAHLGKRYANAQLGPLTVIRSKGDTLFDFGEWKSRVASRHNDDGTTSFMTIDPGLGGFEFVADVRSGSRALVLRDAQHEYRFEESGAGPVKVSSK